MRQMDTSGTEDLGVTARLMYGYLLSNTRVLSEAESSFVLVAGLVPQDVSSLPYRATASCCGTLGRFERFADILWGRLTHS